MLQFGQQNNKQALSIILKRMEMKLYSCCLLLKHDVEILFFTLKLQAENFNSSMSTVSSPIFKICKQ